MRLTGSGKMPVVDMSGSGFPNGAGGGGLAPMDPSVKGLPPKSPVYAAVNKSRTKALPQSQTAKSAAAAKAYHNYCNLGPALRTAITPPLNRRGCQVKGIVERNTYSIYKNSH